MEALSQRTLRRISSHEGAVNAQDQLIVEEPLEISLEGESLAIVMRTPGHDEELVRGLLLAEGVILREECQKIQVRQRETNQVTLGGDIAGIRARFGGRSTLSSAACGVCGAAVLASLEKIASPLRSNLQWSSKQVVQMPTRLRQTQKLFEQCGGVHGAALFDEAGEVLQSREDVGRHNAVDKLVGWALEQGQLPLSRAVLGVSGRLSYEIIHKAVAAGIPIVCAVSAPSSLAVDLAERYRVTIAAFIRGESFNVYSHPNRIL